MCLHCKCTGLRACSANVTRAEMDRCQRRLRVMCSSMHAGVGGERRAEGFEHPGVLDVSRVARLIKSEV